MKKRCRSAGRWAKRWQDKPAQKIKKDYKTKRLPPGIVSGGSLCFTDIVSRKRLNDQAFCAATMSIIGRRNSSFMPS